MSCQLDQVAAIYNTPELVHWLCPHLTTSGSQLSSPSAALNSSQVQGRFHYHYIIQEAFLFGLNIVLIILS